MFMTAVVLFFKYNLFIYLFFFFNVLDLSFDEETVVSSHSFCSD